MLYTVYSILYTIFLEMCDLFWPWYPRPPQNHLANKHFGIPLRIEGSGLQSPRVAPTFPEPGFWHPSSAAGPVILTFPGYTQRSTRTGNPEYQ